MHQCNKIQWQGKHLLNIPRPLPTGASPINILSDSDTNFHFDSTTYYNIHIYIRVCTRCIRISLVYYLCTMRA